MTAQDIIKPSPERALQLVRRMLAEKKAEQERMVEEFKNDPEKQAIVEELRKRNAKNREAIGL